MAKNELTFGGISAVTFDNGKALANDWIELFSDESLYYISKEIYEYDNSDNDFCNFRYRYMIEALDMRGYDDNDKSVYLNIYLVPIFEDWSEKHLEDFCDFVCASKDDIVNDLTYYIDVISGYGNCVLMLSDKVSIDDYLTDFITDIDDVMNKVKYGAYIVPMIERLRGFYLDKHQNMIGTDGWDMIDHIVNDTDIYSVEYLKSKMASLSS